MKKITLKSIVGFCVFLGEGSFAQQVMEQHYISFSNLLEHPVEIEVVNEGESIIFYSINKSNYPYTVRLNFTTMANLSPQNRMIKGVAYPGKMRFTQFKILSLELPVDYIYQVSWAIGDEYAKPDPTFLYMVPVRPRDKDIKISKLSFSVNYGDSIYASRKGVIASLPDDASSADKICRGCLEIYHKDGTIMIYQNAKTNDALKAGMTIFPGQNIGWASTSFLTLQLLRPGQDGRLTQQEIKFTLDGSTPKLIGQLEGLKVTEYPSQMIDKEMTKAEKKNFKKKGQ